MRKLALYLLAVILIAAAAGAAYAATKNTKNHDDDGQIAPTTNAKKNPAVRSACDIFTLADAKELLGDSVKGGEKTSESTSKDVNVSVCAYTQDHGANVPVSGRKSATLEARIPLTSGGAASNQNQFGPLKPVDVEAVTGYGDNAYWDQVHGQLNILKGNNWYILSAGASSPSDRTLEQAKQLADILEPKL
jgi:hypothetical protein